MSFKIVNKNRLNEITCRYEIEAPLVAKRARQGQFVIIRIDENGERIPITIAKKDKSRGTITVIVQEAGKTTLKMSSLKTGDLILDLVGPLGKESDFGKAGKIVFVGGGVGIAELLPVMEYARANRNEITAIIGARTKDMIILEEEIKRLCGKFIVTTDDGSYGRKGLVTEPLREMVEKEKFDLCYTVGPDIMMKAVCELTRPYSLKTLVSLDANMLDATGMCGTCRVRVGGEIKFTCVDGPEFDGHKVDFADFIKRQKRFAGEEKSSLELYKKECKCKDSKTP